MLLTVHWGNCIYREVTGMSRKAIMKHLLIYVPFFILLGCELDNDAQLASDVSTDLGLSTVADSGNVDTEQPIDAFETPRDAALQRDIQMVADANDVSLQAICGDEILQAPEECDERTNDCEACRVLETEVRESGIYRGQFSAGSFDRFKILVEGDYDLELETSGVAGPCTIDSYLTVTSDNLTEPLTNDDISSENRCSALTIAASEGTYHVIVEHSERPSDATIFDYELSVSINPLCTPGEGDCPDPCAEDNGGCDVNAHCLVDVRQVRHLYRWI